MVIVKDEVVLAPEDHPTWLATGPSGGTGPRLGEVPITGVQHVHGFNEICDGGCY